MTAPATQPPPAAPGTGPLLQVEELGIRFTTEAGYVQAVSGVTLELDRGQVLALVGESGSGKSVSALTLLGLTRGPGTTITGRASFDGIDLLGASERELQRVRGKRIAMVFQDPMSSLNPVHRVGAQIAEQILAHEDVTKRQAQQLAIDAMGDVGIPRPAERAASYPHEFSGGMRQRVMIAMALSCGPELLIADEPTTALDVTVQAQILDLVLKLRNERGMAVLLVTHDLGVVAETADDVAVMYGGRIVEQAGCEELFADPRHPYSWGLIGSIPPIIGERPEYLPTIGGAPPSPRSLPPGCAFGPRCPHRHDRCSEMPALTAATPDHWDRCWIPLPEKRTKRVGADGLVGLHVSDEQEAELLIEETADATEDPHHG